MSLDHAYHGEEKVTAIRKVVMEFILDEGFGGMSMHKLAKAAGVSVTTIYIYFKDREDQPMFWCLKPICKPKIALMQLVLYWMNIKGDGMECRPAGSDYVLRVLPQPTLEAGVIMTLICEAGFYCEELPD